MLSLQIHNKNHSTIKKLRPVRAKKKARGHTFSCTCFAAPSPENSMLLKTGLVHCLFFGLAQHWIGGGRGLSTSVLVWARGLFVRSYRYPVSRCCTRVLQHHAMTRGQSTYRSWLSRNEQLKPIRPLTFDWCARTKKKSLKTKRARGGHFDHYHENTYKLYKPLKTILKTYTKTHTNYVSYWIYLKTKEGMGSFFFL